MECASEAQQALRSEPMIERCKGMNEWWEQMNKRMSKWPSTPCVYSLVTQLAVEMDKLDKLDSGWDSGNGRKRAGKFEEITGTLWFRTACCPGILFPFKTHELGCE